MPVQPRVPGSGPALHRIMARVLPLQWGREIRVEKEHAAQRLSLLESVSWLSSLSLEFPGWIPAQEVRYRYQDWANQHKHINKLSPHGGIRDDFFHGFASLHFLIFYSENDSLVN